MINHLKVADGYVDLLCGLPDFIGLTAAQLLSRLPERYRHAVPVTEEHMARAVIIGMLATEAQIEHHLAHKFVERLSGHVSRFPPAEAEDFS